jgi:hypothetical protein
MGKLVLATICPRTARKGVRWGFTHFGLRERPEGLIRRRCFILYSLARRVIEFAKTKRKENFNG